MEVPSLAYRGGAAGAEKHDLQRGGDLRRFDTQPHQFSGGIDLHARTMSLCILNQDGEIMLHHQMKTASDSFLKALAPSRGDLVVGVECLFTWELTG
jgi:hypothetical protein